MSESVQTSEPDTNDEPNAEPSVLDAAAFEPGVLAPTRGWRSRSQAEWTTFIGATCVLLLLVSLIVYDWVVNQNRPPVLQVEPIAAVRVESGQYYVPFVVANTGGTLARTVQVVAELHWADEEEVGEQQIDFLSGGERKQGSFIFHHDPQRGELVLRVASYRMP